MKILPKSHPPEKELLINVISSTNNSFKILMMIDPYDLPIVSPLN